MGEQIYERILRRMQYTTTLVNTVNEMLKTMPEDERHDIILSFIEDLFWYLSKEEAVYLSEKIKHKYLEWNR